MDYAIRLRALHYLSGRQLTRTLDVCPATLGRGADATCSLEGDDAVSNIHVSLDIQYGILLARDVGSTNGTFVAGQRLETDQWFPLGPAFVEHELRLAGWQVFVQGHPTAAVTTIDAEVISEDTVNEADAFLTSFVAVVDRLSDRVEHARAAAEALNEALQAAFAATAAADQAPLARTIVTHYPELQTHPIVAPHAATASQPDATPESAALSALNELSRTYAGAISDLETCKDVWAFQERLRLALDAMLAGLVQALSAVTTYRDVMNVEMVPRSARSRAGLERAIFDWREGVPADGAAIVRRTFHELAVHQLASFNAVLSGVRALLQELAPETIEAEVAADLARSGFWRRTLGRFRRGRALIEAYKRRHRDLSAEESTRLSLMFGPSFSEKYRQTVREAKSSTVQGHAPLVPSRHPPPPVPLRTPPPTPRPKPNAPPNPNRTALMAPIIRPSSERK